MCMQLGHSGRKGSTQRLGAHGLPVESGNWPVVCHPIPYYEGISQIPQEMTRADMDKVLSDFSATPRRRASTCSSSTPSAPGIFSPASISPLTNRRKDEYGGSIENACAFRSSFQGVPERMA